TCVASSCAVPSCVGLAANCGPSGTAACCDSALVPGGSFKRSYDGVTFNDASFVAKVSDFRLDKYEITVGRFRNFVAAGEGTRAKPPAAGAGAHPNIANSGWDASWNAALPADTAALLVELKCGFAPFPTTWTDAPALNESRPVSCLSYATAFAFCA